MRKLLYTGGFMKKKYLTYAGIISAGILIFMFIAIFFLSSVPFLKDSSIPTHGTSNNDSSIVQANPTKGTTLPGLTPDSETCVRSSRFVTIDNLPDMWMNQTYNITGTTDLPAGEDLFVQVLPLEYNIDINPKIQSMTGNLSGAIGVVTVEKGTGTINHWSFEIRTSMLPPSVGYYLVNVSNDRFDPRISAIIAGDAFCTQRFTLKG